MQANWWRRLAVMAMVAAFVACESTTPSPAPTGSSTPTASPSPFVLQSPFGTLRPSPTTPPPTPPPTPNPPDPAIFRPVGDLAVPRFDHTASLLPDGRVIVVGGSTLGYDEYGDHDSSQLDSVEIFDPAKETWTAGPPLPRPSTGHLAVTLHDGRILIGSGIYARNGDLAARLVDRPWIYDPDSNRWSSLPPPPERLLWDTATVLPSGDVLVVGWRWRTLPAGPLVYRLDPIGGEWSSLAAPSFLRAGHTAVLLEDGSVLLAGGTHPASHVAGATHRAVLYEPVADRWTKVGPMALPAFAPSLESLPTGQVLVVGESGAQLYDPASRTWAETGTPNSEDIIEGPSIRFEDGRVLIVNDGPDGSTPLAELYDPGTGTWSAAGRFDFIGMHTATRLDDGRILFVGGYYQCHFGHHCPEPPHLADAYILDPATIP